MIDIISVIFRSFALVFLSIVIYKQIQIIRSNGTYEFTKQGLLMVSIGTLISVTAGAYFSVCNLIACSVYIPTNLLATISAFGNFLLSLALLIIYLDKS